jgi:hypothetical protein
MTAMPPFAHRRPVKIGDGAERLAWKKPDPNIRSRNTGIGLLGGLPWGTHFCLFYETRQDFLDANLGDQSLQGSRAKFGPGVALKTMAEMHMT